MYVQVVNTAQNTVKKPKPLLCLHSYFVSSLHPLQNPVQTETFKLKDLAKIPNALLIH